MKNRTKKLLALLLTLVMTVPMFAFPNVSAETEPQTVTIDFENDAWKTALNGVNESLLTVQEDAELGKVLQYKGGWKKTFVIGPKNFASATAWTMGGDIKLGTSVSANYYGFYFETCFGKTDDMVMLLDQKGVGQIAKSNTGPTTVSNAFAIQKWYSFEMIRDGSILSFFLWEKNAAKPAAPMIVINLTTYANAATVPGIGNVSYNGANEANGLDSVLYMDNLTFSTDVSWSGVGEDFEEQSVGAPNPAISDLTFENEGGTTSIAGDASNKYFTLSGGKYRFYKANMHTSNFEVSGDLYFDLNALTNSSIGFYFYTNRADTAAGNLLQVFYQQGGFFIDSQKVTSVAPKTWQQFKIVRSGTQLSMKIWEKGTAEPASANYTKTLTYTAAAVPMIRVAKFTSDAVSVRFDNINFVNTLSDHVKYAGAQASVETANDATDNLFAVRFLATVDSTKYADTRFNVTATYTENGITCTKTFLTPQKCVAYSSILEYTEQGIQKWDAGDLGGNYLIALNVTDIPKSVGTVSFHVEAYCKNAAGGTVTDSYVVTATVNADGTITLA